jgi:hypothetical protein
MAFHEIFVFVSGFMVAAVVISTAVRLVNGESWESANRFRRNEQFIILFGSASLFGLAAWQNSTLWQWLVAGSLVMLAIRAVLRPARTPMTKPPAVNPISPADSD